MYLIYIISEDTLQPIATASTIKMVTEFIKENQCNYENKLHYMKVNYVWK